MKFIEIEYLIEKVNSSLKGAVNGAIVVPSILNTIAYAVSSSDLSKEDLEKVDIGDVDVFHIHPQSILNDHQLAESIRGSTGLDQDKAEQSIITIEDTVKEAFMEEQEVAIESLGKFFVESVGDTKRLKLKFETI